MKLKHLLKSKHLSDKSKLFIMAQARGGIDQYLEDCWPGIAGHLASTALNITRVPGAFEYEEYLKLNNAADALLDDLALEVGSQQSKEMARDAISRVDQIAADGPIEDLPMMIYHNYCGIAYRMIRPYRGPSSIEEAHNPALAQKFSEDLLRLIHEMKPKVSFWWRVRALLSQRRTTSG